MCSLRRRASNASATGDNSILRTVRLSRIAQERLRVLFSQNSVVRRVPVFLSLLVIQRWSDKWDPNALDKREKIRVGVETGELRFDRQSDDRSVVLVGRLLQKRQGFVLLAQRRVDER